MDFAHDGGGLAKGGTVTLYVDGTKWGEGRVDRTEPILFSIDETCDVGFEAGSPVTYDYGRSATKFSGEVNWVEITLGKDAVRPYDQGRGPRARRDGAAIEAAFAHLPPEGARVISSRKESAESRLAGGEGDLKIPTK